MVVGLDLLELGLPQGETKEVIYKKLLQLVRDGGRLDSDSAYKKDSEYPGLRVNRIILFDPVAASPHVGEDNVKFRKSDCEHLIACYAADEHRFDFRPVKFSEEILGDDGAPIQVNDSERCSLFSGVHADVGARNVLQGIHMIPLRFAITEACRSEANFAWDLSSDPVAAFGLDEESLGVAREDPIVDGNVDLDGYVKVKKEQHLLSSGRVKELEADGRDLMQPIRDSYNAMWWLVEALRGRVGQGRRDFRNGPSLNWTGHERQKKITGYRPHAIL